MSWVRSNYMYSNFQPDQFNDNVKRLQQTLVEEKIDFDSIACRGVSGIMLASPLSFVTKKPLIVVRKTVEGNHGNSILEGYFPRDLRYIIVDDFISTGATVRAIIEEINNCYRQSRKKIKGSCYTLQKCECVGAFFYNGYNKPIIDKHHRFIKKYVKGPIRSIWPD